MDQVMRSGVRECRLQREQFVKRHAQRIDVAARVRLSGEPFGRHVLQRADEIAGLRQIGAFDDLGHTEIGDPNEAPVVQKQIGRLDVAMKNALRMRVFQRVTYLNADPGNHAAIVGGRQGSKQRRQ